MRRVFATLLATKIGPLSYRSSTAEKLTMKLLNTGGHLEWVGAGESDAEPFHYVERVDTLSIRKRKIKALHQPRDSNGDKQHAEQW
jgi:hypothetical protein